MPFKEGDRVLKRTGGDCNSAEIGQEYTVVIDKNKSSGNHDGYGKPGIGSDSNSLCHCQEHWTLISNQNNKSMSNLKQKYALIFKAEPQKSFIKAGITDGDEVLTQDGTQVFLSWLLKKHGDEFKKEVVDQILAEDKEAK